MQRMEGWERRLELFFQEARGRAFEWGEWDCVRFAEAAVQAMTGQWVAGLPHWNDLREALALLDERDLDGWITSVLGEGLPNWRMARRGDLVLVPQGNRLALAVCSGRTLCGPAAEGNGLGHLPLTAALKVWRIG